MAKCYPFLSLDCASVEGVGAQSKESKGSNFAAQRSHSPEARRAKHIKSDYSHLATMSHSTHAGMRCRRQTLTRTAEIGVQEKSPHQKYKFFGKSKFIVAKFQGQSFFHWVISQGGLKYYMQAPQVCLKTHFPSSCSCEIEALFCPVKSHYLFIALSKNNVAEGPVMRWR